MKFSIALIGSVFTALLTPALGCVHAEGTMYKNSLGEINVWASLDDNGGRVCDTAWGWRWDQDTHLSISCVPGYVYAFTEDGKTAWYGYPGNSFSWHQDASTVGDFCNPPQNQWCYTTEWNTYMYC